MKIFFIVDEFPFFLPEYLDGVIMQIKSEHNIVGITPLVTPRGHKTLYTYIKSQLLKLGIESIVRLVLESLRLKVNKFAYEFGISKSPATIAHVARKHKIKTIHTTNVNDKKYQQKLKKLKIDVIVSSNSQIFKKDLLRLPKVACINRHSAYLPAYGGLFPVFYAMVNGERFTGATVHRMVEGIDKGSIISQKKVFIKKSDTLFGLYRSTYEASIDVTVDAINKISESKNFVVKPQTKESYFSFPEQSHWQSFWKKGKRII